MTSTDARNMISQAIDGLRAAMKNENVILGLLDALDRAELAVTCAARDELIDALEAQAYRTTIESILRGTESAPNPTEHPMGYTIITDAAQIAAIDPATFTGAYIGRRYEDGFLDSTQGYVVRLGEYGFSPSGIDVRVTGREPLMWGDGSGEEIGVVALVAGPITDEIDFRITLAKAELKKAAADR